MDVTTFITRLLRACLIAALVLSPGMIKHADATPITSTTIEDLVRPDRSGNPGYQTLFQSAPDRYEFLLWTPDLTTSAGASFTPTFFPVTQVPQYPESSHDSGSFRGFSAGLPSAIQTLSVKITPIADVDITKSLLGNGESFPMLAYDEAFVPSARHHLLPDIAIPEPSTLVLLTTALSGMYAYGFWRRRKHAAAQSSSETMTAEVMHDVKDALTAIQTCAEVLGYDDLDPHDRQEFTRKIAGQVEQCITVIEEFLGNSPDRSGNSGLFVNSSRVRPARPAGNTLMRQSR